MVSRGWWVCLSVCLLIGARGLAADRPNILWLSCEDMSPHLGCYGVSQARTPQLDQLAARGVKYLHATSVAAVCAPSRSAIITGMYPTTLGTHLMRCQARLPNFVRPFPELLRSAGYYCTNNAKQDYQFICPPEVWDDSSAQGHWRHRRDRSQPFFAVFNFTGTHESAIFDKGSYEGLCRGLPRVDRDAIAATIPPYYPDTPGVREDWGRYFDLIAALDRWIGEHLKELERQGEADNTIVFFWSDHGVGLPRGKRWLYDSGVRVPLIVMAPPRFRHLVQGGPGTTSDELVSLLDLGPTVLNLCGQPIPAQMQGRAFLGPSLTPPRQYLFGVRDRMDERYDMVRAVRNQRYKYIRNYHPWKPYAQFLDYAKDEVTLQEMRRLGGTEAYQGTRAAYLLPTKPLEEFYDLQSDPHELQNLVQSDAHRTLVDQFRQESRNWIRETRDLGFVNESEIFRREHSAGSRWDLLRQADGPELLERLQRGADLAGNSQAPLSELLQVSRDPDPSVRWWGMAGLGFTHQRGPEVLERLREGLRDPSPPVRIQAASSLVRQGHASEVLAVLQKELKQGEAADRLQAVIVLDEMGESARPLQNLLQKALEPRGEPGFDAKYVVRVAGHALHELQKSPRNP